MKVNLDLTEAEIKSLKELIPKIQHLKAFIPASLMVLVHKVEQALKEL